ncbi:MAG: immune inhibitor A [Chloroflexi bacterium]|nr:immune inhibitor A [Chloroflexota bacterium]
MLTKMRAIVLMTVALALALLIAACGDDATQPSPASATASPRATDQATPTAAPTPTTALSDELPERDRFDLARRFRGLPADAPRVARSEPFAHAVGDSVAFSLFDLDSPSTYEVTATVRAITDHAYFFVQDGTSYSDSALQQIAADFEGEVWPKMTAAFGEPWTPGVDGDPRITILHANLRGGGGYVSGDDSFPREVAPTSNEREMLYIERDVLSSPGVAYNELVAHELQHLIHANADDGEDSWVNEGLSQVASQLVGGGEVWIPQFLAQPDLQLDHWPTAGNTVRNYAASELFFAYLLDHYGGRDNASALLNEPGGGWNGIDAYLTAYGETSDDVFADWVIANWLDAADGPHSHPNLNLTTSVSRSVAAGESGDGAVRQFAADYLRPDAGTFRFDGADEVTIGVPAHEGAFWWSGRGDSIDSRLTREIDLRDIDDASLRFDAWYEIERDWDYAYVAASTDDGATWLTLPGQRTTADNPTGASFGHGYTGTSGGWIREEIDLSEFAGQRILIRFEYVTDDSANQVGFAVDNMALDRGGFTEAVRLDSGWQAAGFRIVDGPLQQRFIVQLIDEAGAVTAVEAGADNVVEINLSGPSTVVIAAITRGTTEAASYSWSLSP